MSKLARPRQGGQNGSKEDNGDDSHLKYKELYFIEKRKLGYLSYLPQILSEKEYEARQCKEKANEYESQYHEIHHMYATLVRSLASCSKGRKSTNVESSSATNLKGSKYTSRKVEFGKKPEYISSADGPTKFSKSCGKLQTDSPSCSSRTPISCIPEQTQDKSNGGRPEATELDYHIGVAKDSQTVISDFPHVGMKSTLFDLPDVSRKNFDRLATEYTRMKHAVLKIEREKGVDMAQFLAADEYENVISSLREELQYTKLQLDELRVMNASMTCTNSDTGRFVRNCHDLQKKVFGLEISSKNKQDMIDNLILIMKKKKDDRVCVQVDSAEGSHVDDLISAEPTGISMVAENKNIVLELKGQIDKQNRMINKQKDDITQQLHHSNKQEERIVELQVELTKVTDENISAQECIKEIIASQHRMLNQQQHSFVECPESVRELIQEKKTLQEKVNAVSHDLRNALKENQMLVIQLEQMDNHYRRTCSIKSHNNLERDNTKLLQELQAYRSKGSSDGRQDSGLARTSYGGAGKSFSTLSSPDSGFASSGSSLGRSSGEYPSGSEQPPQLDYVCPRCEQEFKLFEKSKFDEHKRKCLLD